jgi:hypothetical protein
MAAPTPPADLTSGSYATVAGFGKPTADLLQYLGTDSGWVSSGFTAQTGWSISICEYRKMGPLCQIHLEMTYTSATTITPGGAGNIADTDMVLLPSAAWPHTALKPIWDRGGTGGGNASVTTAGMVTLATMWGASALPSLVQNDLVRITVPAYFTD